MIEFKFGESSDAPQALVLYSVDEVAELTKLASRTIYRAIADGDLPALRLRGRLRIPDAAFDGGARQTAPTFDLSNETSPRPVREAVGKLPRYEIAGGKGPARGLAGFVLMCLAVLKRCGGVSNQWAPPRARPPDLRSNPWPVTGK